MIARKLLELDPWEVSYDILLIDKSEHFEFICSNFKMLAEESLFKQHAIMYEQAIKSYRSERVKF